MVNSFECTQGQGYSVKSVNHVVRQMLGEKNDAKSSSGSGDLIIWKNLWSLNVPNKVKIIG